VKGRGGGSLGLGRALSLDLGHNDGPIDVSIGPRIMDDPGNPGPRFVSVVAQCENPMNRWAAQSSRMHIGAGTTIGVLADRDPTYELARRGSTRTVRRSANELADQPDAAPGTMPTEVTVERMAISSRSMTGVVALFRAPTAAPVYAPCVFDNLSAIDVDGLHDLGLLPGKHDNLRSWSLAIVAAATADEFAADLLQRRPRRVFKIGFQTGLTCGSLEGESFVRRTAAAAVYSRMGSHPAPRKGDAAPVDVDGGDNDWSRMLRIGRIHGMDGVVSDVVSDAGDSGALVWAPIGDTHVSEDGLHAATRAVAVGVQCTAANGHAFAAHIDDVCAALKVSLFLDE
jgi:hypothetical protein